MALDVQEKIAKSKEAFKYCRTSRFSPVLTQSPLLLRASSALAKTRQIMHYLHNYPTAIADTKALLL